MTLRLANGNTCATLSLPACTDGLLDQGPSYLSLDSMTLTAIRVVLLASTFIGIFYSAAASATRIEVVADERAEPSHGFAATVTLDALPAAIRDLRAAGGVASVPYEVVVRGGIYRLRKPLRLGPDEAPVGAGIAISAEPGREVIFSGSFPVENFVLPTKGDLPSIVPALSRRSVVWAQLPESWRSQWGELRRRGVGLPAQPLQAELFYRGSRLPLARWPDSGFARIVGTPDGPDGLRLTTSLPLPINVAGDPDLWAFGYWASAWAPWHVPVANVDRTAATISLQPPKPRYGLREGGRFYLENSLAALDSPGEWYLDRASGRLYVWPPLDARVGDLELSLTETLLDLSGASDVTVKGVTFEAARGDAVVMDGGAGNHIIGCVIRNIGNLAVRISGERNGIEHCDIHDIGDSGIMLSGGDRFTLTPAVLYAIDNRIHNFGLWTRTYTAGVMVQGVGNVISGNTIFDAPHMGIQVGGNDHTIENNLIHDVVTETNDAGAIYMWGDWGQRGTLIRNNTICNVRSTTGFAVGIYLDLMASGSAIIGNRLFNVQWAALINGGSDNFIVDNIIAGSDIPFRFEAIGLRYARNVVLDETSGLRAPLHDLPVKGALWAKRYPGLSVAMEGDPGMPKRNSFERNVVYGSSLGKFDNMAAAYTISQDNLLKPSIDVNEIQQWVPAPCLTD